MGVEAWSKGGSALREPDVHRQKQGHGWGEGHVATGVKSTCT